VVEMCCRVMGARMSRYTKRHVGGRGVVVQSVSSPPNQLPSFGSVVDSLHRSSLSHGRVGGIRVNGTDDV